MMTLDLFCFIIAMILWSLVCIADFLEKRKIKKENKELRSENDYLRDKLKRVKNYLDDID